MQLSLDQLETLKNVCGWADLADADEPAFELDAVDLSDDHPSGTILVSKRRIGGRRNESLGLIHPDGKFIEAED